MSRSAFHPEDKARSLIDKRLVACGWVIQSKTEMNLGAGRGGGGARIPDGFRAGGLWLDGLTATPSFHTLGFFGKNRQRVVGPSRGSQRQTASIRRKKSVARGLRQSPGTTSCDGTTTCSTASFISLTNCEKLKWTPGSLISQSAMATAR